MVTHSPEHAAWSDRVCFLKDGVIAAEHRQKGQRGEVAIIHEHLVELGICSVAESHLGHGDALVAPL